MKGISKTHAAAISIRESITSLREFGAQLQANGHLEQALGIHKALDDLQRSLNRITVDVDGRVKAVH
ncbi:hypothetical protein NVV94_10855 [Pseudomonas sp. LS1212]|uniref:hypothetical protein n=1 Tax=Pseudomonas sp. LS1212 TaxID=2972478 RepID=UPI00215B805D|nr:hypothetical protein [Pseudomonas sp. LS1212]UVJ45993.1 hypothetical protein NVV94_10855 [Pseudomonas sp. LS1212]